MVTREQVAQRNTNKRNILDNIKYREQLSAIKQIEIKIKEKELLVNASSTDMIDLDADLDKLMKEYDTLKSKVCIIPKFT